MHHRDGNIDPQYTPLYKWPNIEGRDEEGQTYDFGTGRHVYPTTRKSARQQQEPRIATCQYLKEIQERVEAVLKCHDMEAHIGNVIPWIVDDLAVAAAEHERNLLPEVDYAHAVFNFNITEECKTMLRSKIQRAQFQRAHDLAMMGKVDIAVIWTFEADEGQRVLLAAPDEADFMNRAWKNNYGCLDRDRIHAKPPRQRTVNAKGERNPPESQEEIMLRRIFAAGEDPRIQEEEEENMPCGPALSGFYACVDLMEIPALSTLQDSWKIELITVIEPKPMTDEELSEMREYHLSCRAFEEQARAEQQAKVEAARKEQAEILKNRYDERKTSTYQTAVKTSLANRLKHLDLNTA